jgi:hypothetical protein
MAIQIQGNLPACTALCIKPLLFLFHCFDISVLLYVANSINPGVYKALMKELAQTLETQFSGNAESRAAGMIINTMGWVDGLGYEVINFLQIVTGYLDKNVLANIIC